MSGSRYDCHCHGLVSLLHRSESSRTGEKLVCVFKMKEKNRNRKSLDLFLLQQLLFDEVDEIFEGSDRACTPQDAANLKYLDCAIKETLRLYPSIPTVLRTITEEVEIGMYALFRKYTCSFATYLKVIICYTSYCFDLTT